MKVAVLGSGIIGISSAWWLSQAGHDVVVIDRCTGPAQETSLANGAQISVSYAEPWANPQAPLKLLKWMFRDDAPLLFRPQLDWRQWMWGLAFLRECMPGRLAPNIRAMVRMAEYSRATLRGMRAELGIQYDHLERGILNFYRDPHEFENSQRAAGLMRDFGVERRVVTADEVVAIEPALAPHRATIVGGDYTPEDESGDVHLFTVALAQHCERAGVEFRYSTRATRLLTQGGAVTGVELIQPDGRYTSLSADAYVVAMGSFSPAMLRPLGIPCNAPPWGKLTAIDLASRTINWQRPFGTSRDKAPFGIAVPGAPNIAGSVATGGGVLFIGAAVDDYLRAYDTRTGAELWRARLPAGGQAAPISYVSGRTGRQYVVIAAGGHQLLGTTLGDYVVAYALPKAGR